MPHAAHEVALDFTSVRNAQADSVRARQLDGADRLGATCKAGELQGSGRSQGVSLAGLRSSEM